MIFRSRPKFLTLQAIEVRIFLTILVVVSFHFNPRMGQTERYLGLTRAIVDHHHWDVSEHVAESGSDILYRNGKSYVTIPPGISLLLVPVYLLEKALLRIFTGLSMHLRGLYASLSIWLLMAPLMAIAGVLYFRALKKLGADRSKRLWLVLTLCLGSLFFYYGVTGVWTHSYSTAILTIALSLLILEVNPVFIGVTLGAELLIDYAGIVPIAALAGCSLLQSAKKGTHDFFRTALFLGIPLTAAFAILSYYHYSISGNIFVSPNTLFAEQLRAQSFFPNNEAIFGFPSAASVWGLTFSPYRGLFLYFPPALLSFYAFRSPFCRRNPIAWLGIISAVGILTFNACYYSWSGSSCFGPRHLTMALPFLLLPLVFVETKIIRGFCLTSFLFTFSGIATVYSDDVRINLATFLYRGLFLHWMWVIQYEILPAHFGIHLAYTSSVLPYAILSLVLWGIWRNKAGRRRGLI